MKLKKKLIESASPPPMRFFLLRVLPIPDRIAFFKVVLPKPHLLGTGSLLLRDNVTTS